MRRHLRAVLISAGVVAGLLLGGLALGLLGGAGAPLALAAASPRATSSSFNVVVLFDGVDILGHTTAASALPTTFDHTFTTRFSWVVTNGGPNALVTQGTIVVQFLGANVGTSSQAVSGAVPAAAGNLSLESDYTQNRYLFEGVYEVIATLYNNTKVLYQQPFWVWVQADDHLTVVNIVLVVVAAYEIYNIAILGSKRAARKDLGLNPPSKGAGGNGGN